MKWRGKKRNKGKIERGESRNRSFDYFDYSIAKSVVVAVQVVVVVAVAVEEIEEGFYSVVPHHSSTKEAQEED